MSRLLLALAASLLIAGGAAAQTGPVQIKDAWARATPGQAENGAAYLTLQAATPDRLTGVSTPIAKKAELHEMTMDGDIMKMHPLAGIDLPPGQPVALKPGGMHIMLLGLNVPLHPGDTFPLTLSFEKTGKREVTVAVEKGGAMGPASRSGSSGNMPMPMGH